MSTMSVIKSLIEHRLGWMIDSKGYKTFPSGGEKYITIIR